MRKILAFLVFVLVLGALVGCEFFNKQTTPTNDVPTDTTPSVVLDRVVNGQVLANGEALADATVKIRNTSYETTSGSDGKFSFTITETVEELPEFRIIVTKEGYEQATADVLETSFTDGVAEVSITLLSSTVELKGVVSDASGALEGVTVEIEGTDISTTTNTAGEYSLVVERPVGVILSFSKEYCASYSLTLDDFSTGDVFVNNVTMSELLVDISGKVVNNYTGDVAGAVVTVKGTDYFAISGADGSYLIEDAKLPSEEYELAVVKEGYLPALYTQDEKASLELVHDYVELPQIGETIFADAYVTKSSEGLYFKFKVDEFKYESGKEEKIQVFLNPGQYTESSRLNGSHVIEIALTSNNDICVFVNYIQGTSYVTSILWGTELIYTTVEVEDGVELYLYVKYSVFGDYCGAEFAIDDQSVLGINLTSWSDFNTEKPAQGWLLEDMLGVDGKALVYHDNPQDWPRLSADGKSLYEASDNLEHEKVERTISGCVTSNENAVEGALVEIPALKLSATTDSEGKYSITIPENKWAVTIFNMKVSKEGYIPFEGALDSEFANNAASKNVVIEAGKESLNVSGKVIGPDGNAIVNAKVSVVGSELSVVTDSEGNFAFEGADWTTKPLTLLVQAEGYNDKKVNISDLNYVFGEPIELSVKLPDAANINVILSEEVQYLGTVGSDEIKASASFVDGKLTMTYEYAEGMFTGSPFEEQVRLYLLINGSHKYDVRFVANGWIGIWNYNIGNWALWNNKIANPVFATNEGVTTATQTSDLSFFADLVGAEISTLKICVTELTSDAEGALKYQDEKQLLIDNTVAWINVLTSAPTLELSETPIDLGSFGADNVNAKISLANDIITIVYTYDANYTLNPEEWLHLCFQSGSSDIYAVRAINGNWWTGIWNVSQNVWATWTPEVTNPVIVDNGDGTSTSTQTVALSYLTGTLGLDLSTLKLCVFEGAMVDGVRTNGSISINGMQFEYTDATLWPTVVFPVAE